MICGVHSAEVRGRQMHAYEIAALLGPHDPKRQAHTQTTKIFGHCPTWTLQYL